MIQEMGNGFTHEIKWVPAFDKRSSDQNKNYGTHGAEMQWYLTGPNGVIQFIVFTSWHLTHVQKELDEKPINHNYPHITCGPTAANIGYHARIPQYEGQTLLANECKRLNGDPCYYDGSGLNAKPILQTLISDGEEAVWKAMY